MESVSKRLYDLIQQQGTNYRELERITGINYNTIRRYALGETDMIPLDAIKKLASALHVEPNVLIWENTETIVDELFEKRKVLFDLSAKATAQDLDKIIKMVEIMTEEENGKTHSS